MSQQELHEHIEQSYLVKYKHKACEIKLYGQNRHRPLTWHAAECNNLLKTYSKIS